MFRSHWIKLHNFSNSPLRDCPTNPERSAQIASAQNGCVSLPYLLMHPVNARKLRVTVPTEWSCWLQLYVTGTDMGEWTDVSPPRRASEGRREKRAVRYWHL